MNIKNMLLGLIVVCVVQVSPLLPVIHPEGTIGRFIQDCDVRFNNFKETSGPLIAEAFNLTMHVSSNALLKLQSLFRRSGLIREAVQLLREHGTVEAAVRHLKVNTTRGDVTKRVGIFAARWAALMTIVFIAKCVANDHKAMARVYDEKHPENYSRINIFKIFWAHFKMAYRTFNIFSGKDVWGVYKAAAIAVCAL